MTHLKLNRRRFMQGLGLGAGATLLSPLFNQILAADDPTLPRRFVFVVAGNGVETFNLVSPKTRAAINAEASAPIDDRKADLYTRYGHSAPLITPDADLASAPALSPLRGMPGDIDLAARSMVVLGLSSKVAGGGHSSGYAALSSASGRGGPSAPTIDAWLARSPRVQSTQPFDAVRLGVIQGTNTRLQYGLCAFDARKPAPIVVDPTTAHTMLFGSVASAAGQRAFTDRTELLDFARADVRRSLAAFSGGSDERAKLERYLESLEELRQRQDRLVAARDELMRVNPGDPTMNPLYGSEHPLERLDAQFSLATASLLGNLTSVAVLTSGVVSFSLTYSSLESVYRQDPDYRGMVDRHAVCHEAAGNPAYQAVLDRVTGRHVELIARMARALASVPERDGTMLDHTAIVYMSDNGDKHHSTGFEWPVLIVGGSKLGLNTDGRSVVYPRHGESAHRQLSNLFNTLGHAAGEDLNTFGAEGSTRITEGPLPELFL